MENMKTTQKGRLKNPPLRPLMDYLYCEGIFTCEDISFGPQKLYRYILASRLTLEERCELRLGEGKGKGLGLFCRKELKKNRSQLKILRKTALATCVRVDTYLGFLQAGDDESEEEV